MSGRLEDIMVSEWELIRAITMESFYEFVKEFWECISSEKFSDNWHISYICGELQEVAERVFRGEAKLYDVIINIPPGTTKSSICSVLYLPWIWTRMPTARFIGGSYSNDIQINLSRRSKDVITSEKYQACFPEIKLRQDQSAKSQFANTKGGERFATSTGAFITGVHGHFIVIDDPLNPEQATSVADLKTANRWMSETIPTRKINKAVTPTILIMQRLSVEDCTAAVLKKKTSIKHICLPAELYNDDKDLLKPKELKKYYVDNLLDVNRLGRDVLDESKKTLGEYAYAGQMLQSPIPRGGGVFKTDRLKIVPNVTDIRFKKIIRYWDKAATKDAGCNTAGVKMGISVADSFYVLNVIKGQWDTAERDAIIRRTAIMDGINTFQAVEQEPGSGGKESAQNTVKLLKGFKVIIDRPAGDKIQRADPYSSQVNNGNVYIVEGGWNEDYLDEMKFFPNSKLKDQIDASDGCFSLLTKKHVVGGMGHR